MNMPINIYRVRETERAVLYLDGEPIRLMPVGWNIVLSGLRKAEARRYDPNRVFVEPAQEGALRQLVQSGALADAATVLELSDSERALVWVDGRLEAVLEAGLHVLWNAPRELQIERIEAGEGQIESTRSRVVLDAVAARSTLRGAELVSLVEVPAEHQVLLYRNGSLLETLRPGRYGYWNGVGRLSVVLVDLREQVLDVAGQELMTSDKVTLRLNATLSYRITDPVLSQSCSSDSSQALYREAQLALRAVIGSKDLESLLSERDAVSAELAQLVEQRAAALGLELVHLGIRDVILPGEMKTILNRVMEAKRAAEANLITRREETAAMRSQANTAKMLEQSPTLMRLRELEVLEKIADEANLQVVLSDGGLTDRLMKLV